MSAINFNQLHPGIDHDISGAKYSELGEINGLPTSEFINKIKEEFDSNKVEEIIKNPPENIKAFIEYVRGKFPVKVLTGIASSYPFVVPKMTTYTQDLVDFLVNATQSVNKPEDFLYWITRGLFPCNWNSSNTSISNANLRCISKVKVEGIEGEHLYAAITTKNEFIIYNVEGDKTKVAYKCKYAKHNCIADENKVEIFTDPNGQPAKVFTVEITSSLKMWENVFEENCAPFPFYINFPDEKQFPELVTVAVYYGLMAADKYYIKALFDKSVTFATPDIYNTIIDIYSYANRMPDLFEAIVSQSIEGTEAKYKDLIKDTHTAKFFEALCLTYANQYYNGFGRKLVSYINERSADIESEKVFFTIVKYIKSAIGDIPEQLRLFLSIVAKYCDVRFNKMKKTAKAILGLFFGCILRPLLINPTAYFPDFEVKDAEAFSKASGLLEKLFALDKLGVGDFDRRRKAHTKKQLIAFAYAIAECPEVPAFTQCTLEHLTDAIGAVIQTITDEQSFKKNYIAAASAEDFHASGLAFNLAVVIGSFFVHGQDVIEKKEEVPPPVETAPVEEKKETEEEVKKEDDEKKETEEEVKKEEEKKEEEEVKKDDEEKKEEGGEKKRRRKEKKDDDEKKEEKKEEEGGEKKRRHHRKEEDKKDEEEKKEEGGEKKRRRKEKKDDDEKKEDEEKKEEGGEKKRRHHKKEE